MSDVTEHNDNSQTSVPTGQATATGRARRWLLPAFLLFVLAIVLLVLLLKFVIDPMLRQQVDPNAGGPDISSSANDTDKNDQPILRDSITDLLVLPPKSPVEHPLDPALQVARLGLQRIKDEVRDYTALLIKQERIDGVLLPEEAMRVKVRHATNESGKAFYVHHVSPEKLAGQEAIWVEGQNKGKLIAHGTGWQKLVTVRLAPTGIIAMQNNRYPITELGIETLIQRMLEKGDRDRKIDDDCQVTISRDLKFDGHDCTLITITHPKKMEPLEFYQAKIYIDDELQLPVGYEGFLWPDKPGDPGILVERYFYRELKTNVGLTDIDFDHKNPEYEY